jgi:uncharacterized RDD family membrane protein YckC
MSNGTAGVSPVPREARPYQGRRAGLITRSAAAAVDALVVVATLAVGYAGWVGLHFVIDPRGFELAGIEALPGVTWFLVVAVVYLTAAWSVTGRTYGCHLMGLRVVNRRGRHPGVLVAAARAVLYVLFPIGLLWCAVSRSRRSLQDLLLGSTVIYDWLPEAENGGAGPTEVVRLPRQRKPVRPAASTTQPVATTPEARRFTRGG